MTPQEALIDPRELTRAARRVLNQLCDLADVAENHPDGPANEIRRRVEGCMEETFALLVDLERLEQQEARS
jgi:hypothetical protein